MKKGLFAAAVGLVALAPMAMPAAQAATTYTIIGPATTSSVAVNWANTFQCDPAYIPQQNNTGVDSVVIDVGARSALPFTLPVRWTSASGGGAAGLPTLQAYFRNSKCAQVGPGMQFTQGGPGTWNLVGPQGAKWLIIESRLPVGVTLTV